MSESQSSPDIKRTSAAELARGILFELRELAAAPPERIARGLGGLTLQHSLLLEVIEQQEQQLKKLESENVTDELTGLLSRRGFKERFAQTLSQWSRHNPEGRGLALARIDLDGFRDINNTYGHHAGDAILRKIGHRLGTGLREHDLAIRFSGDEFGLCLSGVNLDKSQELVEKVENIRLGLIAPVQLDSGIQASVGATMGMLIMKPEQINAAASQSDYADRLCVATDLLQVDAKRLGKNRLLMRWAEDEEELI